MKLAVKVIPGSSREEITGWLGDVLKVRVMAPSQEGKANLAVERILSRTLGLPKNSVRIVSGRSSAQKIVEISGLSDSKIDEKLPGPDR